MPVLVSGSESFSSSPLIVQGPVPSKAGPFLFKYLIDLSKQGEQAACLRPEKPGAGWWWFLQVVYLYTRMKTLTELKEDELVEVLDEVSNPFHLIVWNDEVNTFEWVIETLMEICNHSYEQAEQCAYVIHFKGKYAVKHGSYEVLKPMCDAITDRGIGATVEMVPA